MATKPYRVADHLTSAEEIAEYLNAVLDESSGDAAVLLLAFRNVAEAVGGVSELARRTGLDRAGLSRVLSGRNSPKIDTVSKIASACGVRMQFSA